MSEMSQQQHRIHRMFLLCLKELLTNYIETCRLVCFECAASQTWSFLSLLSSTFNRIVFFRLFCWGEAKGKVACGGCDLCLLKFVIFHNWIVVTDSSVCLEI